MKNREKGNLEMVYDHLVAAKKRIDAERYSAMLHHRVSTHKFLEGMSEDLQGAIELYQEFRKGQ